MNSAIGPRLPLRVDKKNGFFMIDTYSDEIKQNLKILFLTAPGERVMDANFGVGVRNFLFENVALDPGFSNLKARIRSQVARYIGNSIKIISVSVVSDPQIDNVFYISFVYNIPVLNITDSLDLTIN